MVDVPGGGRATCRCRALGQKPCPIAPVAAAHRHRREYDLLLDCFDLGVRDSARAITAAWLPRARLGFTGAALRIARGASSMP